MPPLLSVSDLTVVIQIDETQVELLRQMSFEIDRGDFVGLVGESGSGKSMTALALMRLLPPACRVEAGRIEIAGENLLDLTESQMASRRGSRVAMVFQEPMTALNPVLKVGYQVAEAVRAHRGGDRRSCWEEAAQLLKRVAIGSAADRLHDYPHQLSGGQRQRVMIAMALAGQPDLLIADEPTSALDVTIQMQILELLEEIRQEMDLAILMITHDLALVAETCDKVMVMYAGEIVERAKVVELFQQPEHPYSRALLGALPRRSVPSSGTPWRTLPGSPPEFRSLPPGCSFHPRCTDALDRCGQEAAPELLLAGGRSVRCWLHQESQDREVKA